MPNLGLGSTRPSHDCFSPVRTPGRLRRTPDLSIPASQVAARSWSHDESRISPWPRAPGAQASLFEARVSAGRCVPSGEVKALPSGRREWRQYYSDRDSRATAGIAAERTQARWRPPGSHATAPEPSRETSDLGPRHDVQHAACRVPPRRVVPVQRLSAGRPGPAETVEYDSVIRAEPEYGRRRVSGRRPGRPGGRRATGDGATDGPCSRRLPGVLVVGERRCSRSLLEDPTARRAPLGPLLAPGARRPAAEVESLPLELGSRSPSNPSSHPAASSAPAGITRGENSCRRRARPSGRG